MKNKIKTLSLLPLLTCALLLVSLAAGVPARAANQGVMDLTRIQQTNHPSPGVLQYHGGPVMGGTSNDYLIFWEPSGSHVSHTYNNLIKRYFNDVGVSDLYHNNTQYQDGSGSKPMNAVLAGSWVDTSAYPAKKLTDAQIQSEVSKAQATNGWSSSIENAYFVFLAKGESICFAFGCSFQAFCSYHNYFGSTIYAAMPYAGTNLSACGVPKSPNHNPDADSEIN